MEATSMAGRRPIGRTEGIGKQRMTFSMLDPHGPLPDLQRRIG